MSYELINTSAPRGLMPGSRGFTTVAMTADTPPPLIQVCDGLSNYTHVFGLESGSYADNPPAFSHFHVRLGSRSLSVLSRVAAHAPDYSGRTNRIAHHVVLDTGGNDRPSAAGPAATLEAIQFLKQWEGDPRELPPTSVPIPPGPARLPGAFLAKHWQDVFGAPDLAASLAGAWMAAPNRPTFLIVAPNNPHRERMVGLIGDAIRLLPPEMRWGVTFSTYLSIDPPGGDCVCRGLLPDSAAERQARRIPDTLIINFESGTLEGGAYGRDIANTLNPAAKGSALPPWAIPAPAQMQARTQPVARFASSGAMTVVQASSEVQRPSTSNQTTRIHGATQPRPIKKDRTIMIAGIACAAVVAVFAVVLTFPLKHSLPVSGITGTNAFRDRMTSSSELADKYPSGNMPTVSSTNQAASISAVVLAAPAPTNNVPAGETALKSGTTEPPALSVMETTRVKTYAVQSSLPQEPSNKQETLAVLYSGEVVTFVWKEPSSFGTKEWFAKPRESKREIKFTPPENKKPAQWDFPCSMVIQSSFTNIVIFKTDTPFVASFRAWEPDVKNSDERATVAISVRPPLRELLTWLLENAKTKLSLSNGLILDKDEWIEKQQQWKLSVSRAPDASRKARKDELKKWQACTNEVEALLQDIGSLKKVQTRDGDLETEAEDAINILATFIAINTKYPEQTAQPGWTEQAKWAGDKKKDYHTRLQVIAQAEKNYPAECEKGKKEGKIIETQDFGKKRRDERRALVDNVHDNINLGNLLRNVKTAATDKTAESGPRQWPSSFDLNFDMPSKETICFRVATEGGISQ
jgi:hypothetical protein